MPVPRPSNSGRKQRSSQNALKHGLTAARLIIPGESEADFDSVAETIWDAIHPEDGYEEQLVIQLISLLWRARRVAEIEVGLFKELILQQSSLRLQYTIAYQVKQADENQWKTGEKRKKEKEKKQSGPEEPSSLKESRAKYAQIQRELDQPLVRLARQVAEDPKALENINRYETQIRRALSSTQAEILRWRNASNGSPTPTVDVRVSRDP